MRSVAHKELTLNVREEVLQAENRIRRYVRETPLEYSFYLSRLAGCNVFLKLENYSQEGVVWRVAIHALFLFGALMLGLLDRITRHGEAEKNESV